MKYFTQKLEMTILKELTLPEEFILIEDYFEFKKGTHFKITNANYGFEILLINGKDYIKTQSVTGLLRHSGRFVFAGQNAFSIPYKECSLEQFNNIKAFL